LAAERTVFSTLRQRSEPGFVRSKRRGKIRAERVALRYPGTDKGSSGFS
jgi:hypothetical protein